MSLDFCLLNRHEHAPLTYIAHHTSHITLCLSPPTHNRVDCYGVRPDGTSKPGCLSRTLFLGSNGLLCPRWCVTYNNGKSIGRNGCFGRISPEIVQPTVVTRPEPHNLQV